MVLAFCSLGLFAACSDWTDVESVDLNYPTIQEQNPALYAAYVKALNEYKATPHQVVITSVDNVAELPANRSQHLTNMPDSIDYICLNRPEVVNSVNQSEIAEVRKLGTKVLGLVDFDAIEAAWQAKLAAEEAKNESVEGEESGEEPDNAARFIEFCRIEANRQIEAVDALALDGIELNYTGYDLNALVTEEELAAEAARQDAFFGAIAAWKTVHAEGLLFFKGFPQNVMDKSLLSECMYIIVHAHSARNAYEMSYLLLMATVEGVPSDRFVMGVTTPYVTATGSVNGELGDGSSAITGAAQWAVAPSTGYTKAGISIDAAQVDYFNPVKVYPNIREALSILNPIAK